MDLKTSLDPIESILLSAIQVGLAYLTLFTIDYIWAVSLT